MILSQILGGISKIFITKGNEADAYSFVEGFAGGVQAAYKAVVKPMEGTILTVCREASEMPFFAMHNQFCAVLECDLVGMDMIFGIIILRHLFWSILSNTVI